MQDKNVLLTYTNSEGLPTFEWFENTDKLFKWMDNSFVGTVIECMIINEAKDITKNVSDY